MTELLGRLISPLTGLISGALELFHSMGAPWWLSIALLTVSVRALLLPLTLRQAKNVRAMQELKPHMDEIRSRYTKNRKKQQEAIMELYRKHRVNPLGGFLPVLAQVPVFITVYRVVRVHEETLSSFASGGLLWFGDLTRPDPFYVLPVLSASLLLAAGQVSARNVDRRQRRMMLFVPLAFTAFIVRFPAGLFVYWITSNAVTLIQNMIIYRPGIRSSSPQAVPESAGCPAGNPPSDSSDQARGLRGSKRKRSHTARRKRRRSKR